MIKFGTETHLKTPPTALYSNLCSLCKRIKAASIRSQDKDLLIVYFTLAESCVKIRCSLAGRVKTHLAESRHFSMSLHGSCIVKEAHDSQQVDDNSQALSRARCKVRRSKV